MAAFARQQHLDFLPTETIRPSELPWSQFAILVVVRHPLHAFLSKCSHPWWTNRTNYASRSAHLCMCNIRGRQLLQLAGCPGGGASPSCKTRPLDFVARADLLSASRFLE
eukprot:6371036-Prymnesium_polylepis.1